MSHSRKLGWPIVRGAWTLFTRAKQARILLSLVAAICILTPSVSGALSFGVGATTFSWIDPVANGHTAITATSSPISWSTTASGGGVYYAPNCAGGTSYGGGGYQVDDDITQEIDIGFKFATFDTTATPNTKVRINANGRIQFNNNNYCWYGTNSVGPPPTYLLPYPNPNLNYTMRVYGSDFCPAGAPNETPPCSGTVYYTSTPYTGPAANCTASNRCFVATWYQMKEWNSGSSLFNVQMIIYENGDFVYQYKDVSNNSQGVGQVGWQLTSADYALVDLATINSLSYSALRFSKTWAPVVEYRFDKCSVAPGAGAIIDSGPNHIDGTAVGALSVQKTGELCTALNFDGAPNATDVQVPSNAVFNIASKITVAAWVRHSSAGFKTWETILAKGDSAYRLHLNGGCSIGGSLYGYATANAFTFGLNGGCGDADLNSGVVPAANTWYHVVGTYDGFTMKIFINGLLANSVPYTNAIGVNGYPLYVGENSQYGGRNWSGDIDELKVYNTALRDADVLMLYQNEAAGFNFDGSKRICVTCPTGSFGKYNGFDRWYWTAYPNSVDGAMKTKVAGQAFAATTYVPGGSSVDRSIDVVALNAGRTAIDTTVNASVNVSLISYAAGAAMSATTQCPAAYGVIYGPTSVSLASGHSGTTFNPTVNNAYPYVKVLITDGTNTSCSNDSFAIRPYLLNLTGASATDLNWTTPGTSRALNNGANFHKAGQPFSINNVVAITSTLATASLYSGSPYFVPGNLVLPDPTTCPACILDRPPQPTWTGTGTITTSNLVYREVGAFTWELEDRTFSTVDNGDSTVSERYFRSNGVSTAGRFVPDHFAVGTTSLVPRSDIAGCSASAFTYMGEPMQLALQLIAQEATASATTQNYVDQTKLTTGNLVTLGSNNSWGLWAVGTNVAGNGGCRAVFNPASPFSTTLSGCTPAGWPASGYSAPSARFSASSPTLTWSAAAPGKLTLGAQIALNRANSVDGPLTTLAIGIAPQDADGVTMAAASLNLDADGTAGNERASIATTDIRYGQLKLQSAYGSELLDIRLPVRAEYYAGANGWTLNAQDGCTSLPSSAIALGNYLAPPAGTAVSTANMGAAHRPASAITLSNGSGTIVFAKPNPVATGSFDVVLNLGNGVTNAGSKSCEPAAFDATYVGGTAPATSLTYLSGNWCGAAYDKAPSARIKLGSPKAPYIYMRERY